MACKFIIMCVCDIYNKLAEQRYVCEWDRDGVMFMCAHVYDVAHGLLTSWPPLM